MEETLESLNMKLNHFRKYICGTVHNDTDHIFDPSAASPVVCGKCSFIKPNSGVLGDIEYAFIGMYCAFFEYVYVYMVDNDLSVISTMEIGSFLLRGVLEDENLKEVDRYINSIEQWLSINRNTIANEVKEYVPRDLVENRLKLVKMIRNYFIVGFPHNEDNVVTIVIKKSDGPWDKAHLN